MHAITGITGTVGTAVANALLAAGERVRAVVRDAAKGERWATRGCEVVLAAMDDEAALARAFDGAGGVFILPPPEFDPEPDFSTSRAVIGAVAGALRRAKPAKVVCLSTIGADAAPENLLSPRGWMEAALGGLALPVRFLRPAWFLENAVWDVAPARDTGVISSFLTPLDRAIPMVSARDVGATAARLLREDWTGVQIVELEGPAPVSPNELAAAFSRVLARPVRAEEVPHASWEPMFRAQGMKHPTPRIRMLDGFNEGWIAFHGAPVRGTISVDDVIGALVSEARP
jgi:uncharacterized protein YbjT (DUF2867 family)